MGKHKRDGEKPNGDVKYIREFYHEFPDMTDEVKEICTESQKALPKDKIIDYLARYLSVNKDMRTSEQKRAYRFADDADTLFGLPEYAVVLGIVECIEQDESNWYPPVSKLKKFCDGWLITWPAPDELEGWQDA